MSALPLTRLESVFTAIGPENAVDYLRDSGRLAADVPATAHALAWGVSNVVLRIEPERGEHFVVKQSRERLRTEADWFSRLDRIFREAETMAVLERLLPTGVIPRVLFEDRENYLFAMEAVPADHVVWKEELLRGRADAEIARRAGGHLAAIHARTSGNAKLRDRFGDRTVFDELRIDPFYRRIAAAHPPIAAIMTDLIDEMSATPLCLVHADFSPKNILIVRRSAGESAGPALSDQRSNLRSLGHRSSGGEAVRLALVDFETAHYGDPAFDLGFFFSHLLLKTVLHSAQAAEFLEPVRTFHSCYFRELERLDAARRIDGSELDRRSVRHTAACMLARIDGKSTIDYLTAAADQKLVRQFSLDILAQPPPTLDALYDELDRRLQDQKMLGTGTGKPPR